jgi:hypothetical protein
MYVAMHFAAAAQVLLFSDQFSVVSDQFRRGKTYCSNSTEHLSTIGIAVGDQHLKLSTGH